MKKRFMELARKLSHTSEHKFKHGSVVVRGNRVISMGVNTVKTHTKSPHPYKTLHAEASAILQAGLHNLQGADIYVYRETKNGCYAESKPCKFCQELIEKVGIRRVWHTTEDGNIGGYKV